MVALGAYRKADAEQQWERKSWDRPIVRVCLVCDSTVDPLLTVQLYPSPLTAGYPPAPNWTLQGLEIMEGQSDRAVAVIRSFVSYLTSAGGRLLQFNSVVYQCDLNVSHDCSFFICLPTALLLILLPLGQITYKMNCQKYCTNCVFAHS